MFHALYKCETKFNNGGYPWSLEVRFCAWIVNASSLHQK